MSRHEAQLRKMLEQEDAKPTISAEQFLLKTLFWLPICFIGWYWVAALFSFPSIKFSDALLPLIMPGVIEGVEQQGYMVDIITQLNIQTPSGQIGQLTFEFNALKYGYGFPLILAMMFATPYSIYSKLDDITYGLIMVILTQAWGVCFEALSSLLLKTSTEITNQIDTLLPYTQNEIFLTFVALGYQLGFLILPAIVPIAFWIMRHKGLLEQLAEQ